MCVIREEISAHCERGQRESGRIQKAALAPDRIHDSVVFRDACGILREVQVETSREGPQPDHDAHGGHGFIAGLEWSTDNILERVVTSEQELRPVDKSAQK